MITSGTETYMFEGGAAFIVSSVIGRCKCSRSAFLFVGRNGSTHCLHCDHFYLTGEGTADEPVSVQDAFEKAIV